MRLIERIGEHYRTNIANRYIRTVLLQMSLDKTTWNQIETLTEKFDQFRYRGIDLDELYRGIAAVARFVSATRREVAPTLRHRVDGGSSGPDKVLRDMAVNAFSSNLNLFAEMVCELYEKVKEIDALSATSKPPVFQQVAEFNNLHDMLMNG